MCESAFAAARSMPDLPALKPYLLGLMGRAYVLHGELVFLIAVDDAGLALIPCSSWEVAGSADPRAWRTAFTWRGLVAPCLASSRPRG